MNVLTLMLASVAQVAAPAAPLAPVQAIEPQATASPVLAPPDDWSALPELRLQHRPPEAKALSSYVRDEVRAGRCVAAGNQVRVELAVLVAGNGQLRRVRPRAIGCPTVEQYASGVMLRIARSNVAGAGEERWYRAALDFAWQ